MKMLFALFLSIAFVEIPLKYNTDKQIEEKVLIRLMQRFQTRGPECVFCGPKTYLIKKSYFHFVFTFLAVIWLIRPTKPF